MDAILQNCNSPTSLTRIPVSVNVFKFFLITVDTVRKSVMHSLTRSFRPTRDVADMVIFLKERESIKPDHFIRDPIRAKEVSHGFSYKQNDLEQSR